MRVRRAFVVFNVVVLGSLTLAVFSPPGRASAAEVQGAFTSVTISPVLTTPWQQTGDPTAVPDGSLVDVSFTFSIPDATVAGDTASMTFESSGGVAFSVGDLVPFPILSDAGETIATVTGAGGTVTVTFAPYVDTHTAVSGSVTLQAKVSAATATETPTVFAVPIVVSDGTFPGSVRLYRITDVSDDAAGVRGGLVEGASLEWTYFSGVPLFNLDLALMDGATSVDCAALQLEYRDAAWTPGDPYPSDAQFGAPAPISSATCTPVSPGLEAATQVVSVAAEAAVPVGLLREFRLTTQITSAEQPEFQAVLATTDGASQQSIYFAGLAGRQTARGTGTGTLIPVPPVPTPTPDTGGGSAGDSGTLADSGLRMNAALPGVGFALLAGALVVAAVTRSGRQTTRR